MILSQKDSLSFAFLRSAFMGKNYSKLLCFLHHILPPLPPAYTPSTCTSEEIVLALLELIITRDFSPDLCRCNCGSS